MLKGLKQVMMSEDAKMAAMLIILSMVSRVVMKMSNVRLPLSKNQRMMAMVVVEQVVLFVLQPGMSLQKRVMIALLLHGVHMLVEMASSRVRIPYESVVWSVGGVLAARKMLGLSKKAAMAMVVIHVALM